MRSAKYTYLSLSLYIYMYKHCLDPPVLIHYVLAGIGNVAETARCVIHILVLPLFLAYMLQTTQTDTGSLTPISSTTVISFVSVLALPAAIQFA